MRMDKSQAVEYLESLLDKTLRLHTSDTRLFVGIFKCTDNVSIGVVNSKGAIQLCPSALVLTFGHVPR